MEENKIKELKNLLEQAAYAPTKKDAKPIIKRLEFIQSHLGDEVDPYHSGKLGEAICYSEEASGRVKNKGHWIESMHSSWHVFESKFE